MLKLKVLMIDDEIDYCRLLETFFRKKNYEVQLAFNLSDGLQLIGETKPDILLLDNNLPDGKGWTHVESIVEKNPQLKIFLVSAHHQKGDFFYDSPNVTVWEKPLSMSLLNDYF
ncbi:MAG: response regulator [Chitinophagaceae bacterium]